MSTEIEIFAGHRLLGLVRERHDGTFVAVAAEQVIGPFPSARSATDAVLDIVRSGAGND
jgi:hypothetical protein